MPRATCILHFFGPLGRFLPTVFPSPNGSGNTYGRKRPIGPKKCNIHVAGALPLKYYIILKALLTETFVSYVLD